MEGHQKVLWATGANTPATSVVVTDIKADYFTSDPQGISLSSINVKIFMLWIQALCGTGKKWYSSQTHAWLAVLTQASANAAVNTCGLSSSTTR